MFLDTPYFLSMRLLSLYFVPPELISADEVKKTFEGYHPSKVEKFHTRSAKVADKMLEVSLKKNPEKEVYLMCGGTASGKTEFLSEYLDTFDGIVFDGTLATPEGAHIKIRKIQKAKKIPIICAVIPLNLHVAFTAFLHRERKFSDVHFFKTHAGARKTLLWVAESMPHVELRLYRSTYIEKKMVFQALTFEDYVQQIEFLRNIQYTEDGILKEIKS